MKKSNSGKHLFQYYTSQVHSVLSDINKVKEKASEENIHLLRVDIKKLRAIFNLLELLFPTDFKSKSGYNPLKAIFKNAGKTREMQVNMTISGHYKLNQQLRKEYNQFLKKQEEFFKRKLKKSIGNFEASELKAVKLKPLCDKLSNTAINDLSKLVVTEKFHTIKWLLASGDNPVLIHKIRIQVKFVHAIITVFYKIHPNEEMKKLLTLTKEAGMILGNWHDKYILRSSLEKFMSKKADEPDSNLLHLVRLLNKINRENNVLLKKTKHDMAQIKKIIKPFAL